MTKYSELEVELFPISALSRLGKLSCVPRLKNDSTLSLVTKKGNLDIIKNEQGFKVQGVMLNKQVKESKDVLDAIYKHYGLDPDSDTMSLDEDMTLEFLNA